MKKMIDLRKEKRDERWEMGNIQINVKDKNIIKLVHLPEDKDRLVAI